jgi:hypothetical protein
MANLAVIEPDIYREHRRLELKLSRALKTQAAQLNVPSIFGWIVTNVHAIIVCTEKRAVNIVAPLGR